MLQDVHPRGIDPKVIVREGMVLAGRFELLAGLGKGAAGVVYEARDRQRDAIVALKALRIRDPEFLYLLKREFRSLTNLSHPNLVTLHELVVDEELAFITMERVDGVPWLRWVRDQDRLHVDRLRDALGQLVRGLHHLHRNGLVHRDVKPSNVMVTTDGTVKLLDFGLALATRAAPDPSDSFVVGTLEYLSPEQARGQPASAASDWYATGVMLYEALAGRTPWAHLGANAMLLDRMNAEPTLVFPPSVTAPTEPAKEALDLLCLDLRLADPDLRPSAEELLRRLGAAPPAEDVDLGEDFVGRGIERSRFAAALEASLQGLAPRLLTLCGHSGTGKSAMARALLGAIEAQPNTLVLRGQCFERETVRYSGIDAVVDALRTYLLGCPPPDVAALLPPGAAALSRAFPVLEDLFEPSENPLPSDPLELQRAAADALHDLIAALTQRCRVVVFIDDLHWCGDETTRLLLHLLRSSEPAGFVIMGTYRTEMLEHSPSLQRLLQGGEHAQNAWSLELGPLPFEESRRLAASRLGVPAVDDVCDTIAHEAGGNPLFVEELARHARRSTLVRGVGRLGLETITQTRVRELPANARALLQVVAIAGGPLVQRTAFDACGETGAMDKTLAELRAQHFVRTYGPSLDDSVEVYHGRVRLAVVEMMDEAERAEHHFRLALAWERAQADSEVIAFHFARSSQPRRAVGYLRSAAQLASRALAFRRAADLAKEALGLLEGAQDNPVRGQLETELGDALSNDGRGAEAAEAYLRAAAVATGDALELRRRATEQYLRSGHTSEGLPLLTEILAAVGLRLARSPRRAIGSWLLQRASIALQGTGYVPARTADLSRKALLRVDICWTAATGLPAVDLVLGQDLQARHLRLALQLGEPRRVARALSLEILYAATAGTRNTQRVDALIRRVQGIAKEAGSARVDGLVRMASGVAATYRGEFRTALEHLGEAARIFRNRCTGAAWELSFTSTFEILARLYLGDLTRLMGTLELATSDALARDDLSTMLMVRIGYDYLRHLIDDQPSRARAELEAAVAWRPQEAQTPTYRFTMLMARGRIERYAGRASDAYACFAEHARAVRGSMMLTKQPFLLFFAVERSSGALWAAHATAGSDRERLLAVARRDIAKIRGERTGWGAAFVGLLEASLFAAQHQNDEARQALRTALDASQACGMALYHAAAQVRLDELAGARTHDVSAFTAQGVRAPLRMANMHAPPVIGW